MMLGYSIHRLEVIGVEVDQFLLESAGQIDDDENVVIDVNDIRERNVGVRHSDIPMGVTLTRAGDESRIAHAYIQIVDPEGNRVAVSISKRFEFDERWRDSDRLVQAMSVPCNDQFPRPGIFWAQLFLDIEVEPRAVCRIVVVDKKGCCKKT